MDRIVHQLVAGENEIIRASLERGATVMITGLDVPGKRVAHRIGCPSSDRILDRTAAWTPQFWERLLADRDFQPRMPHLQKREEARRVTGLVSCGACKPQIFDEPVSTRELRAKNLKTHHIGLPLSDEHGADLGVISAIDLHKDARTAQPWDIDNVTVTTDNQVIEFAGKDVVRVWDSPNATKMAEREQRIRALVGA